MQKEMPLRIQNTTSSSAQAKRNLSDEGNVLYLHCPGQWPIATGGYLALGLWLVQVLKSYFILI